jgi:hypothetical protein
MSFSKEKTEEIIQKIEEAVKKKTKDTTFKCNVCTNDQFSLVGGFSHDFLIDKFSGNIVLGGVYLPSVPVVCNNCGNTYFLNAKILGLDENLFADEKKEEEGE